MRKVGPPGIYALINRALVVMRSLLGLFWQAGRQDLIDAVNRHPNHSGGHDHPFLRAVFFSEEAIYQTVS